MLCSMMITQPQMEQWKSDEINILIENFMEILLVAGRQFLFDMAASQIYSIKLLTKLKVLLEASPEARAATEENNSKVCNKIVIVVVTVLYERVCVFDAGCRIWKYLLLSLRNSSVHSTHTHTHIKQTMTATTMTIKVMFFFFLCRK